MKVFLLVFLVFLTAFSFVGVVGEKQNTGKMCFAALGAFSIIGTVILTLL